MTENYKDFLKWATPQITVDQYQLLCKIIYSFKKYKETDEPGINPEGSTFISDIVLGIAELKEKGELK